jgi:hypothetical protein
MTRSCAMVAGNVTNGASTLMFDSIVNRFIGNVFKKSISHLRVQFHRSENISARDAEIKKLEAQLNLPDSVS